MLNSKDNCANWKISVLASYTSPGLLVVGSSGFLRDAYRATHELGKWALKYSFWCPLGTNNCNFLNLLLEATLYFFLQFKDQIFFKPTTTMDLGQFYSKPI